MKTYGLLLAATAAIGTSFAFSATPAIAGDVCELDGTSSLGGATAAGTGALACGINANGSGDFSTAVGFDASAGTSGTAVGSDSQADGDYSVAIGAGAQTDWANSIVIDSSNGGQTGVGAQGAIAIGRTTTAQGTNSIAMGNVVNASGASSIALGDNTTAGAGASVAIGVNTYAAGTSSVAMGIDAQAYGKSSVALGDSAIAAGSSASAIGDSASASGDHSAALGQFANASGANSVAIGSNSVADEDNIVSVGSSGNERRVTNVAAGVKDTDAVNVGQLNAAIAGFSAFDPSGLQSQLDSLSFSLDSLSKDVHRYRQEARRGTALAVAMSEAPMPSRDGGISYSLHGASYRGNMAMGASVKYRINRGAAIDFGVSSAGHKDTAVRLGVSGEF